jgi:hypothetical protein
MKKLDYEKMLPGVRLWTGDMEVEMDAIEQIRNVTQLPILAGPVVVMPGQVCLHRKHAAADVHAHCGGHYGRTRRDHRANRLKSKRAPAVACVFCAYSSLCRSPPLTLTT